MKRVAAPFGPITRRRFLRGHLALGLSLPLAGSPLLAGAARQGTKAGTGWPTTRHAIAFGTRVAVTVAGVDPVPARQAADAAIAEIAAVEAAVSLHAPESPLARLNRDGRLTEADPHLARLMDEALRWSAASDGAFDVTVQPLWRLYFAAAARGILPDDAAVERARDLVAWRAIRMQGATIGFERHGVQVTLNGIAQGYAADRAWHVLHALGIEHALVDAGEWRAGGRHDAGRPWRLGIRDPLASAEQPTLVEAVALQDAALATSGIDGYRFTPDGRLYHILDPRTGRSPTELAGVTVLAPDACTADALSTACMVLGVERSLALVDAQPGTAALLVRGDGRQVATTDWPG